MVDPWAARVRWPDRRGARQQHRIEFPVAPAACLPAQCGRSGLARGDELAQNRWVAMAANTSFNDNEEPIGCTPHDSGALLH
jgi:hypothetical protein